MNKFYVTKEIAEKLRAKGYNVEELHYENSCLSIDEVYQTDNLRIYKLPRIDEVLAWLRDEKGLYIRPSVYFIGWCYDITTATGKRLHGTECEYYSYEETVIAGIEYVIDNLI